MMLREDIGVADDLVSADHPRQAFAVCMDTVPIEHALLGQQV